MPFYAVRLGKTPGVYSTWAECQEQVTRFAGARYKKFNTENEAWAFVNCTVGNVETSRENNCTPPRTKIGGVHGALSIDVLKKDTLSGWALPSTSTGVSTFQPQSPSKRDSKTLLSLKHVVNNMKNAHKQMKQYILQADELIENLQSQGQGNKRSQPVSSAGHFPHSKRARMESVANRLVHTSSHGHGADDVINTESEGETTLTVFTDGCCTNNGHPNARAGIGVYWGPADSRNVAQRLGGRQTNNRAEIHAAIHAIRQAKRQGARHLVIKTDSQFMINSMTKWIVKWKTNGWTLANGNPVVNKEDFEELDEVQKDIGIAWVHVRGHQGIMGNEQADQLANEGASKELFD